MRIKYYSYVALRDKATSDEATAEDRIALVKWFERYDMADWNGEYYDMGHGLRLFPVYDVEYDEQGAASYFRLVDAEIR